MKKVIKMMNDELDTTSLASDVLDNVFEMWWTKLEEQISKAVEKSRNGNKSELRSDRELIEEVLSLTRGFSIDRRRKSKGSIHPDAIEDLLHTMESLVNLKVFEDNPEGLELFERFYRPIEHIIEEIRDDIGRSKSNDLSDRLRRLKIEVESYSNEINEKISPRIRKRK